MLLRESLTMSAEKDNAIELADEFKKDGHFDKLKEHILSRSFEGEQDDTVVQVIRNRVSDIVKKMISEDENLLFKNRGSTSALLESQLLKDDYKKLADGDGGINVEENINTALNDPQLFEQIKSILEETLHNMKRK